MLYQSSSLILRKPYQGGIYCHPHLQVRKQNREHTLLRTDQPECSGARIPSPLSDSELCPVPWRGDQRTSLYSIYLPLAAY